MAIKWKESCFLFVSPPRHDFIYMLLHSLSKPRLMPQCRCEPARLFLCEITFTHWDFSGMWMKLQRGPFLLYLSVITIYCDVAAPVTCEHTHTPMCTRLHAVTKYGCCSMSNMYRLSLSKQWHLSLPAHISALRRSWLSFTYISIIVFH